MKSTDFISSPEEQPLVATKKAISHLRIIGAGVAGGSFIPPNNGGTGGDGSFVSPTFAGCNGTPGPVGSTRYFAGGH